jgi:hypothetical protein
MPTYGGTVILPATRRFYSWGTDGSVQQAFHSKNATQTNSYSKRFKRVIAVQQFIWGIGSKAQKIVVKLKILSVLILSKSLQFVAWCCLASKQ